MPPNSPFTAQLAANWPPGNWHDVRVLVAVSGGADSVALLRGLRELTPSDASRLVVGHFHHGLRPEADTEEQFVVELARQLGLACEVGRTDVRTLADAQGDGLEAAARHARHEFLHAAAHRVGARFIATAHTADDQVETILHRIVRGTGLAGLAGIPRTRVIDAGLVLIRPLLHCRRADVLTYLQALGQPYREDSSNLDPRFTRNRLRHELLPLLADEYNPRVRDSLLRLGQLAGEAQELIGTLVEEVVGCAIVIDAETVEVDVDRARSVAPYLVRELLVAIWKRQHWPLQAMGFAERDRLADMIRAGKSGEAGSFPGEIDVRIVGNVLSIKRKAENGKRKTSPLPSRDVSGEEQA